jgi:hypothetical protein
MHIIRRCLAATTKVAALKEQFTSTVAASDIGDAASGAGATPADIECLSSDDEDE